MKPSNSRTGGPKIISRFWARGLVRWRAIMPALGPDAQTPVGRGARSVGRPGRAHAGKGGAVLLGIGLWAASNCWSAPIEDAPAPWLYGDDELLVPEVFQGHLPTTLQKSAVRFAVNPHLGDFQNKDHLRLSNSLRFGLTENLEISAGSDLYFSHGHGDIPTFENYGISTGRIGAKVNLGEPLYPGCKVGAGIEYGFPVGRPPAELTDGLRHLTPYVTFSHRLKRHPDLRIFWGLRLDGVTHTSVPGTFAKNALHDSSTGLTGGWVVDRKNWHYTFEMAYDTTRWIGHTAEDVYTFRPGVIWEIPSRRDPQVKSPWSVGVALKSTFGPGGTSLGTSFRVRYSRDFNSPSRLAAILAGH